MKLHAVLIPYLLLFFILPLPCPAQSQEDTLTNVEQIANSEEYEVYAKSVQLIAYFLNDNDVDFYLNMTDFLKPIKSECEKRIIP